MKKIAVCLVALMVCPALLAVSPPEPVEPLPSAKQLAWQRMEMTMFLHFGVNTFTDREWGDGKEDPAIFNPSALDAGQWVRVAKDAGFKLMILTAKHHDGFCLWPSEYTKHSVASSAWKNGRGDVVKEFVEACREQGMKTGIYLSPWDRNYPGYGDSPRYNRHFTDQLTEISRRYGPIDEYWFDGANGEGPNGKRQEYDWKAYYDTIYGNNPEALIAICGPDVRWVGNESGVARVGESSVKDAQPGRHFGQTGKIWFPAECDVSIRPGWFYHASQDGQVKSLDHLLDIYFKSVGRNSVLLLNVPPNREGLFSNADVTRLREFKAAIDEIFSTDFARDRDTRADHTRGKDARFTPARAVDGDLDTYWATDDGVESAQLEVDLGETRKVNVVNVQEYIPLGERVQAYRVEARVSGRWRTVGRGTVIGHKNLLRFPAVDTDRLRLVIEKSKTCPAICAFGAFFNPHSRDRASGSLAAHQPVEVSNVHPGGTVWGGDKAVDDDMSTRWATSDETRACWLEVDLGAEHRIGSLRIAELQPRITRFQLEVRNRANEDWRVAMRGDSAGTNYRSGFDPVKARYVRLNILEASNSPTIWEFQVFSAKKEP